MNTLVPARVIRIVPRFEALQFGLDPVDLCLNSADALFSGTMTERDALKTLAVVGGLLIALTLIPTLIKRFTKRADAVRPYR